MRHQKARPARGLVLHLPASHFESRRAAACAAAWWKDTADTGTYLRLPPSCIRRGRRYGPRSTRPSLFGRDRINRWSATRSVFVEKIGLVP